MDHLSSIDLINYGNSICPRDPSLAQNLISKGILKSPNLSVAYYNLGIALHMQRKVLEAIRAYRKSIDIPGEGKESAKQNLALDLLLTENFEEGWNAYEARLTKEDNNFFKTYYGQEWNGLQEDKQLPKNLILVSEQGLGDTIQFCRFAIAIEKLGVNVILFCQSQLILLLKEGSSLKNVTNTLSPSQDPRLTKWCSLLSMPLKCKINAKIPQQNAYIKANLERISKWKSILMRQQNHKLIGLHWQGNLEFEKSIYNEGRSMHFNDLLEIKNLKGIEFVSLQKGVGQRQLKSNLHLSFVEGQYQLNQSLDFRDTAAVIDQCDLVITTDSVIAHLAGAMGIETWVALPWVPEWRWGLQGNSTQWYPSIRLFRQQSKDNWSSVIKTINVQLHKKFGC